MSEWKEGAAERRDARATKDEIEQRVGNAKKKDTKRWCRGKVGKEHTSVVGKRHPNPCGQSRWFGCWHYEFCSVCGKNLQYFMDAEQCPEQQGV